jgi:hypothetical protein
MNDFHLKSIYGNRETKGLCFMDALCRYDASMDPGKVTVLKRKYVVHLLNILKTMIGMDASPESVEALRQIEAVLMKVLGE